MSLTLSENPPRGSVETWGVGAWTIEQNHMVYLNKPEKGEVYEKNRKNLGSKNEVDITKKKDDEASDDEEAKTFGWKKKDREKKEKAWEENAITEAAELGKVEEIEKLG